MPLPAHRADRPKRRFDGGAVACEVGQRLGCGTWCCERLLIVVAREDLDEGLETEPGFVDLLRRADDGRCAHLDGDGRCSVWERRPLDCRLFTCEGRRPPDLAPAGDGPPRARPACVHCGAPAARVVALLVTTGRIRCAACGGPYLPELVDGAPLRLRPDRAPCSVARGLVDRAETREHLGDLAGARAALEGAAAEGGIEPLLGIGRVASAAGDEAGAEAAFARAERIDAARAWLGRGLAHDAAGRAGDALGCYHRARALRSESPWLAYGLARAARASGDAAAAAALLETAARASGHDVRVVQDLVDLAREGAAEAVAAIERLADRRALAALGRARPYLADA